MKVNVKIYSAKILGAMHYPKSVFAEGNTVGECLDNLVEQYPEIEDMLFDKVRRLRRELYVYVNAESLKKVELSRILKTGDELIIAVLVTGG